MSIQCNFVLNRRNAVFYSGEIISGAIILNTENDEYVHNVSIVFLGVGKVRWKPKPSEAMPTFRKSDKVYANNTTIVQSEGLLTKGQYTFTFNMKLALECPSSCEGKYGYNRYVISLIIERPQQWNKVFQKPLTVLDTVDLNLNPVYKIPLVAEDSGYKCICFKGSILYTLRIPFGAYAPGQMVNYSLRIQNQTMTETLGYSLKFYQKQTFYSDKPKIDICIEKIVLLEQEFNESCMRSSTRVIKGQFRIPPVAPTTFVSSSKIHIKYWINVTVILPGSNGNTDLQVPLVIGTKPLIESLKIVEDEESTMNPAVLPSAPKMETSGTDLPSRYNGLKPPTYEEAMSSGSPFVDEEVAEDIRIIGFRPLYPMYT